MQYTVEVNPDWNRRRVGIIKITSIHKVGFSWHMLYCLSLIPIVILRSEENWVQDYVTYTCICESFRELEEGDRIPFYDVNITHKLPDTDNPQDLPEMYIFEFTEVSGYPHS